MDIDEAINLTTVNEEYLQQLYEEQGYHEARLYTIKKEIERVKMRIKNEP